MGRGGDTIGRAERAPTRRSGAAGLRVYGAHALERALARRRARRSGPQQPDLAAGPAQSPLNGD